MVGVQVYGALIVSYIALYIVALYDSETFSKEWWAAVAFFVPSAVTVVVKIGLLIRKAQDSKSAQEDRALFNDLIEALPEGEMFRMDKQDFLATYRASLTEPVMRFEQEWCQSVQKEFLDKKLNRKLKKLKKLGSTLAWNLAQFTTGRNGEELRSVVPAHMDPESPEEWVKDQGKQLNQDADRFCEQYRHLVRAARRRLNP